MSKGNPIIHTRVSRDVYAALIAVATERETTVSEVIKEAISDYLSTLQAENASKRA